MSRDWGFWPKALAPLCSSSSSSLLFISFFLFHSSIPFHSLLLPSPLIKSTPTYLFLLFNQRLLKKQLAFRLAKVASRLDLEQNVSGQIFLFSSPPCAPCCSCSFGSSWGLLSYCVLVQRGCEEEEAAAMAQDGSWDPDKTWVQSLCSLRLLVYFSEQITFEGKYISTFCFTFTHSLLMCSRSSLRVSQNFLVSSSFPPPFAGWFLCRFTLFFLLIFFVTTVPPSDAVSDYPLKNKCSTLFVKKQMP